MKKKKKAIITVAGLAVFFLAAGISISVHAEKTGISSNGNLIFNDNEKEAGFYAEDIRYLQKEINSLFHEMEENENE